MRVRTASVAVIGAIGLLLTSSPAAAADGEAWFWRWSDGSRDVARSVHVGDRTDTLPTIEVTVRPADRGRPVALQRRVSGRWLTEDSAVTNRGGVARLALNPFCADGDWCDGRVDYRLRAGGRTAGLSVRFAG